MDRGTWWATYSPWGRKELDTTERLNNSVDTGGPLPCEVGLGGGHGQAAGNGCAGLHCRTLGSVVSLEKGNSFLR